MPYRFIDHGLTLAMTEDGRLLDVLPAPWYAPPPDLLHVIPHGAAVQGPWTTWPKDARFQIALDQSGYLAGIRTAPRVA